MDDKIHSGIWRKIHSCCRHGERINKVSDFAERLFWRMHLICDDYGAMHGNPIVVRSECVPMLDVTIEQVDLAVQELIDVGLVAQYFVSECPYLSIIDFSRYQTSPNGKFIRKFPSPIETSIESRKMRTKGNQIKPNVTKVIQMEPTHTEQIQIQNRTRKDSCAEPPTAASPPAVKQPASHTFFDLSEVAKEYTHKMANLPPTTTQDANGRQKPKDTPSTPQIEANRAEEPIMELPCVGTGAKLWPLIQAKADEYATSFPGIDVIAEIRKARQWLMDNPKKRKTYGGMPSFLGKWLGRAQDTSWKGKFDERVGKLEKSGPNGFTRLHEEIDLSHTIWDGGSSENGSATETFATNTADRPMGKGVSEGQR